MALNAIDWGDAPAQALESYQAESRSCADLLQANPRLRALALVSYPVLDKPLPIRPIPGDSALRVQQLIDDGFDQQASVTYASSGASCETDASGWDLLRIVFKPHGLERFFPGVRARDALFAGTGLSPHQLANGHAVSFRAENGGECAITVWVGTDELIALQAGPARAASELVQEARMRAVSAPGDRP